MKIWMSASLLALASWPALAQDYPSRPVRLIAPYAAGNGADVIARLLADGLGKQLKQTVYVENRSGASGAIGTQVLAAAAPDGYSISLGGMTTHTLAPIVLPKLAYDPVKDFSVIGRVGVSSIVLVAHNSFPANNIKELKALTKSRPDLQYGSWGQGSTGHFCGEVLNQKAGMKMTHMSFGAQILQSLLGGHVEVGFIDLASAVPLVKTGKLKALAMCTRTSPSLPGVASYAEQGIAFDQDLSWAMYAPAKTPKPVMDKLAEALKVTLADPAVVERLKALGTQAEFLPGSQQAEITRKDIAVWRKIGEEAKVKFE
ncbi:twin-arginine translocation pathway signal [Comamonas serinivorans]|uniref:Twin-arginine translocation pathway signal n=1 Tax=Comamonas serinivorans TaxID=1082851 RepID=A0A1Y0ESY3_9BURK|nr:tripartite tricarboxylate transporter substrate binding protein [Comamonas serinivorans]ARU06638.1 twin-arginine translocation pathway signal [Comamonas serinivorans]